MPEEMVWQDIDRRLLTEVALGNLNAFSTFYDRLSGPLFTLCWRMTGEAAMAEDIFREVFIAIWRKADSFDPAHSSVFSWAVHLTRCMTIAHMRDCGCRLRVIGDAWDGLDSSRPLVEPENITPGASDEARCPEQTVCPRQLLDVLTSEQRQVLELAFFSDLSHYEISARLEMPLSTVKSCIRRGLLGLSDGIKGVEQARRRIALLNPQSAKFYNWKEFIYRCLHI